MTFIFNTVCIWVTQLRQGIEITLAALYCSPKWKPLSDAYTMYVLFNSSFLCKLSIKSPIISSTDSKVLHRFLNVLSTHSMEALPMGVFACLTNQCLSCKDHEYGMLKCTHNALFWISQLHSVNDSIF